MAVEAKRGKFKVEEANRGELMVAEADRDKLVIVEANWVSSWRPKPSGESRWWQIT